MPDRGSAVAATSGTDRMDEALNPFWYAGRAKNLLTPNPPWPEGGVVALPSHQVSLPYVKPTPGAALVPPTAVACGESDGTPIVLGAPSRHVEPESPLPLKTLIPEAAAVARIESMLWASASV